ncbi:hypothetical protein GYMLUDRAFT_61842 [Collybiopsis luxurians FD-317 M1]|uniref:Uncharacterized protein n=1 Tax=Collybiopsis luxurians FD-317 M1 TaxID=944289 RepID=A0A0D0CNI0_9AGAR|nr:hypothetical protein GYMLUDRAFT_61842 [Collybiopsis luxurians FD-317 M1]
MPPAITEVAAKAIRKEIRCIFINVKSSQLKRSVFTESFFHNQGCNSEAMFKTEMQNFFSLFPRYISVPLKNQDTPLIPLQKMIGHFVCKGVKIDAMRSVVHFDERFALFGIRVLDRSRDWGHYPLKVNSVIELPAIGVGSRITGYEKNFVLHRTAARSNQKSAATHRAWILDLFSVWFEDTPSQSETMTQQGRDAVRPFLPQNSRSLTTIIGAASEPVLSSCLLAQLYHCEQKG